MAFLPLAIGAGIGLLKGMTVDRDKEDRERQLAAQTQKYSPWTHLTAGPIEQADPLGSALQFGGTAQALSQNFNNSQAQTAWLNRGGSPLATSALNNSSGMPAMSSYWNNYQPTTSAGNPWHV